MPESRLRRAPLGATIHRNGIRELAAVDELERRAAQGRTEGDPHLSVEKMWVTRQISFYWFEMTRLSSNFN